MNWFGFLLFALAVLWLPLKGFFSEAMANGGW